MVNVVESAQIKRNELSGHQAAGHRGGEHHPADQRQGGGGQAVRPEGGPPPRRRRRHLRQPGPPRIRGRAEASPPRDHQDLRLPHQAGVVPGLGRRAADGVRRGPVARRGREAQDRPARASSSTRSPRRWSTCIAAASTTATSSRPTSWSPSPARVKLIDFGTAWIKGQEKGRVQGTPSYMAPEQGSDRIVDDRTDIYNFGATMYRMFTGRYANPETPMHRGGGRAQPRRADRGQ